MPIKTLIITQHDLQPYYYAKAVDSDGANIDITGAKIRTTMRAEDSTTLTISRSTAGITISAATAGEFHNAWQAGETGSTGSYDIEFEITPAAGGKFTLPSPITSESTAKGPAHVNIVRGLDAT